MKYVIIVIIILIYSILVFIAGWSIRGNEQVIIEKRDTVLLTVPQEPIVIKAKPIIKYIKDTVILTKPFVAKLDTIYKHDTIKVSYEYPANIMDIIMKLRPDTVIQYTITQERIKERSIYIDVLTHIGATAVGLGVGYTLGKVTK